MGYELHITRRENWFDEGKDISLQEWIDYVTAASDMRLDGYAEAKVGETVIRIEEPGISVWTGWSANDPNGNQAWFYFGNGSISVKNPNVEIRRKMFAIAQQLGARVLGDEGEVYGESGEPEVDGSVSPRPNRRPWWKIW